MKLENDQRITDDGESGRAKAKSQTSSQKVSFETVLEKLKDNNLAGATAALGKLGCKYEQITISGGWTLKFTYDGKEYTHTYIYPTDIKIENISHEPIDAKIENIQREASDAKIENNPKLSADEQPVKTPAGNVEESPTNKETKIDGTKETDGANGTGRTNNSSTNSTDGVNGTGSTGSAGEANKPEDKNVIFDNKNIADLAMIRKITSNMETMHTEFGMDANGNIVFQEKSTKQVFDNIFEVLKQKIGSLVSGNKDLIEKLGEDDVLKKLIQVAWINTYRYFDSSQENRATIFVSIVLDSFDKLLTKIQENPDLIDVLTQHSSYADSSITNGLKHYNTKTTYGGDETITYSKPNTYDDGTVHIDSENDDIDYQSTMNDILQRLIAKYPSIDKSVITELFRNAQRNALNVANDNRADCPYGTGNNSSRVEDSIKNWGGKDSRKKDSHKIHMDELVQLTLYNFDKLIYDYLINGPRKRKH